MSINEHSQSTSFELPVPKKIPFVGLSHEEEVIHVTEITVPKLDIDLLKTIEEAAASKDNDDAYKGLLKDDENKSNVSSKDIMRFVAVNGADSVDFGIHDGIHWIEGDLAHLKHKKNGKGLWIESKGDTLSDYDCIKHEENCECKDLDSEVPTWVLMKDGYFNRLW